MNLIPLPNIIEPRQGSFTLDGGLTLSCDEPLAQAAELFIGLYEKSFGKKPAAGGALKFIYDPSLAHEEYKLSVGGSVEIRASGNVGAVYAVQTLRQLAGMDCSGGKAAAIPYAEISDKPRFGWRGVSFDVSRHFFGIGELTRFVDFMSLLKLNVLHLHLSDDQGFRVQIERYPELNSVGSWRNGTLRHDGKVYNDNVGHGGFYTKEELKGLVAYALARGVEIVPELDIPGHTVAIVASLPRLGCKGGQIPVREIFGISKDILCGGNDETYKVICDILDEITEIFPSRYVHLGGDEAPKQNWQKCPRCQAKIKEMGLKGEEGLQAYMFNYFADYLAKKGKTAIGWNECLNDGLAPGIVCQHWTPKLFGRNALSVKHVNNGRKTIVSDYAKTYFDYAYAMTPLKKTFGFDPFTTLSGIKTENRGNVIGVECNIWTEYIPSREKLDFNVFPRILGFAENAWRDQKTSYAGFVKRLNGFYPVLDALDINYAKNQEYPLAFFKRLSIVKKSLTTDAFIEVKKQRQPQKAED